MGDSLRNVRAALTNGDTIETRMKAFDGRPSGFEYLRLVLAIAIVFNHSAGVPGGAVSTLHHIFDMGYPFYRLLVPMFFAVSGYLVAGSLDRTRTLKTFLGFRALRIFPALWADVLFSALLLGPVLTTLPIGMYFSNHQFWTYLLNLVGEVHYSLPGVFKNNPDPEVNGQLWTIPWELLSYLSLTVLAVLGIYKRRALFLAVALLSLIALPIAYIYLAPIFVNKAPITRVIILSCFILGAAFNLYRDKIRLNLIWFLAAVLSTIVLQVLNQDLLLVLSIPIVYVTIYLGVTNPPRTWFVTSGDYSYGLFLYHRQIQQSLWLLVPFARSWGGIFLFSLPITFVFAFLSWHLIEKRALALKSWLYAHDGRGEKLKATQALQPESGAS